MLSNVDGLRGRGVSGRRKVSLYADFAEAISARARDFYAHGCPSKWCTHSAPGGVDVDGCESLPWTIRRAGLKRCEAAPCKASQMICRRSGWGFWRVGRCVAYKGALGA